MTRRAAATLAALALIVSACSTDVGFGGAVEGTRWVLDSYEADGVQTIVPDTLYADAEFGTGRVHGFSGCNDYRAIYRTGPRMMHVSPATSGERTCDQAAMTFEQQYLELLDRGRFYGTRRGALHVYDADRTVILVYHAAPRNPLLGKWLVEGYAKGDAVAEPVADAVPDVSFRIASTGGYAGCNTFSAAYGTNGDILRIGRVATTHEVCSEAVMEQEAAVLEALETAARIDHRGSRLMLTNRNGKVLLALVRPDAVSDETAEAAGTPAPRPSPPAEPTATAVPVEPTPSPEPPTEPPATRSPLPRPTPEATTPPPETTEPPSSPGTTPRPTLPAEPSPTIDVVTATCDLAAEDGRVVANLTYVAAWYTLEEPPELACRAFDPDPIEPPAEGETPDVAVTADVLELAYGDAVAAATDPANWEVSSTIDDERDGVPVTCVAAVATTDATGIAEGDGRYACFADVGDGATVVLFATEPPGSDVASSEVAVVSLMMAASTFLPAE
jgi:heat shock protein HslJ